MKKILARDLFIVFYQYGKYVNQWAINNSNEPIYLVDGADNENSNITVYIQEENPDTRVLEFNPYTILNPEKSVNITYLKDTGYYEFDYKGSSLKSFRINENVQFYDKNGGWAGVIQYGTEIGILDGDAGFNNKNLLAFNVFDKHDGKGWIEPTLDGYGFIDIGSKNNLKMFNNPRGRALLTPLNEPSGNMIFDEWAIIGETIRGEYEKREIYLRSKKNDLETISVKVIKEYFAFLDLENQHIGDPSYYFMNNDIFEVVCSVLIEKGNAITKDKFKKERDYYLSYYG